MVCVARYREDLYQKKSMLALMSKCITCTFVRYGYFPIQNPLSKTVELSRFVKCDRAFIVALGP